MAGKSTEAILRDRLAWYCDEAIRWIEEAPGDRVPDLEFLTTQMKPIAEQLGYRYAPIDSTGGIVWLADPYEGYWPPEPDDQSPCSKSTAITMLKRWVRMLKGPNELPTERHRHLLNVGHTPPAGSERGAWAPPKGYVGATAICKENRLPRSTLEKWAETDAPPVQKRPSTGECFYPQEWLSCRLASYTPRGKRKSKA